ncbi:MAG TPA: DUF695 domain-containing protein [Flavisolibacter sp.]|nr:DUF695 domain-containing protein [Flavisolibacter sp.]
MRYLLTCVILACVFSANAQNENDHWEAYLAQYDDGVGSTTVNMTLRTKPAFQAHRFLLIAGVGFTNCKEGFPLDSEFGKLHAISDSVFTQVKKLSGNAIHAGSFTQNCERLEYIYVKDTAGLRSQLTTLYQKRFPRYKPVIKIREDKAWEAYHKFLYPNEETMDYISNSKVVLKLQAAGDKLTKPRTIDHWLYFKTDNDRNLFIVYAQQNQFTVAGKGKVDGLHAFSLHLTKTGTAELDAISHTTLQLKREAEKHNGLYDGWESVVVK